MVKVEDLKVGSNVFVLLREKPDTNGNATIVECVVGVLDQYDYSPTEETIYTISPIDESIDYFELAFKYGKIQREEEESPKLFKTKNAALSCYKKESLEREKPILSMSKEKLLELLYYNYLATNKESANIEQVLKAKIKDEFKIELD